VNPLDAVRSIKRPSLKRPSIEWRIPSPWLIGAVLVVAVWIGWAIYVAADRGVNAGLGVLVAWPALLLLAAIVATPFVAIAYLVRYLRNRPDDGGPEGDENITGETFPL